MKRVGFEEEHDLFRDSFRTFLEREGVPHSDEWEHAGLVDRSFFEAAGDAGFLAIDAPEELGGGGVRDFRYNQIIAEEIQDAGLNAAGLGLTLHNDTSCTRRTTSNERVGFRASRRVARSPRSL
jgi:alkylation response protein AidB-like acyl-CoA dehydrogenase